MVVELHDAVVILKVTRDHIKQFFFNIITMNTTGLSGSTRVSDFKSYPIYLIDAEIFKP